MNKNTRKITAKVIGGLMIWLALLWMDSEMIMCITKAAVVAIGLVIVVCFVCAVGSILYDKWIDGGE